MQTQNTVRKPDIDLGLAALCSVSNGRQMSCSEIAEVCGCSEQRIREIEASALRKLRHPSRRRPIQEAMQAAAM